MLPLSTLDDLIDRALDEDIAGGDLTTQACIDPSAKATAKAIAREPLVVCGASIFFRVFQRIDPTIQGNVLIDEGTEVPPDAILWSLHGSAGALLLGERTALNFVQRLCGIATMARKYVQALPSGARTRITDTRKTTPGLRTLERHAVRVGGAHNHRHSLSSAVLIKDNHIAVAGGVGAAIQRARAFAPHTSKIEVEVQSLEELDQAIDAHADIVMLDNFSLGDIQVAMQRIETIEQRPLVEVSGGITLERIPKLAALGIDVISVGALTHSVKASDIALEFTL